MILYTLLHGKSKRRLQPIMVDSYEKCLNYQTAREKSSVKGWHEIIEGGDSQWKQKTCTIGGNKVTGVLRSKGKNRGPAGYVGKGGFNQHT